MSAYDEYTPKIKSLVAERDELRSLLVRVTDMLYDESPCARADGTEVCRTIQESRAALAKSEKGGK